MAQLPTRDSLGSRPIPQSRRSVATNPAAGVVGQALEGAGQTIGNIGETLLASRDKAQYAVAGTAMLRASNEALAAFETDPDYATYAKRYREQMLSAAQAASKGLANNEDRATFMSQANLDIERGAAQADKLSRVKGANTEINAVEESATLNRMLAVNAVDPADRERAIILTGAGWDGLKDKGLIDPATAFAKKREFVNQVHYDTIDRLVATGDLEKARDYLKSNLSQMDEKDVTRAGENIRIRQAGMDAEARRVEAEKRAEQAHAVAVAKDQMGAVEQGLNDGSGTVEDRLRLAQQYSSLGDQSKAAEWVQKATSFAAVQGTKNYTLPQMDGEIARLTAKQSGKGGLSAPEAALLNGLKEQRSQSSARLNQPGGALLQLQYATGQQATPIDLSQPASLRQRGFEATAAAQTYRRASVEPLLPEELKPLQDLVSSGDVTKKTQALLIISQFGTPAAIAGAAKQVTDDPAFRVAVTRSLLPAGAAVSANILGGAEALKADPRLWQIDGPNDKLVSAESDARALFAEYVPALGALGSTAANDTYEAAKAYYASKMLAAGKTKFDHGAWRNAIETVIGAYSQGGAWYGGTATYQGQRVVIPTGWTPEGLFRRIARASPQDWIVAAGNRNPLWPDGSKVYTGQLRELVPVWMGGTTYGFRSPKTNNFLNDEHGQPFTIDAAKVPWR